MDFSLDDRDVKILVIDNNEIRVNRVKSVFGKEFDYICFSSAQSALDYLSENCNLVGVIMINFEEHQKDELQNFYELKNRSYLEELPVWVYSDHFTEEEKNLAYDVGVTECFELECKQMSDARRARHVLRVYMKSRERELYNEERDTLTGVLNLAGLRRRFNVITKIYNNMHFIVMYVDFKDFKYFNTVYGYGEGNRFLRYWCDVIRKNCKSCDYVCRITGDQFVIVLPGLQIEEAKHHFETVLSEVREHFKSEYEDYNINLVGGIYDFVASEDPNATFDQVVGFAKQAQKELKAKENSGCAVYEQSMWENQERRIEIDGHLDAALKNGEIMVYLQPQYNYVSGELIGAECLCRWNHKTLGTISPGEFIPILEESGKIYELDRFVWDVACQYLQKWKAEGHKLPLSVNMSRRDIEFADVPMVFFNLVQKYDLEPSLLRIEITEGVYVDEATKFTDLIKRFSDLGFSVEMDDFGSGFSSLNLLHNLDVDVLKLDMGFMKDSGKNSRSGSIINAIVKMAHVLDIKVLAEGVETAAQAEFLKNIGCLMAQGYYFSKPVPREEFEALFDNSVISKMKENPDKYQPFNIQDLFDRNSSGFFIFNNCMGPTAIFSYNGEMVQPVIVNDEFVQLMNWQRDFVEKHRKDVFPTFSDNAQGVLMKLMKQAMEENYAHEEILSQRTGKYINVVLRHISRNDDEDFFICEATDVSKEKMLESLVTKEK